MSTLLQSGRRTGVRRGNSERGFALLLVFLMAAGVALMLYRQLPRAAFESERDKEQLLIDRGEQYKRAIQMFYVANKRWPATVEELEKFQDKRFLRRRYTDPMTGKDEWRLIHHNGMYLTDSLLTKPPTEEDKKKEELAANTPRAGTGAGAGAQPEVNAAVLRRPSDRPLTGQGQGLPLGADPFDPNNTGPGEPRPAIPLDVNAGQQNFPQPNFNQTNPGAFGQNNSFNPQFPPITLGPVGGANQGGGPQNQPFQPQFPGQQFPGQQPLPGQFPGQQFPGQQPLPGQFPGQFPGAFPGQGQPQQPQPAQFRIDAAGQFVPVGPAQNTGFPQPGFPQPGFPQPNSPQAGGQPPPAFGPITSSFAPNPAPNTQLFQPQNQPPRPLQTGGQPIPQGAGNSAINLINQLLTTPRQPPAGINTPLPGGITPGATGIAGVASTSTAASIKLYKERGKYNEWEFVFELQQQGVPGQAGAPGQPNQPGQPTGAGQPTGPGQPFGPSQPFGPGQPGGLGQPPIGPLFPGVNQPRR